MAAFKIVVVEHYSIKIVYLGRCSLQTKWISLGWRRQKEKKRNDADEWRYTNICESFGDHSVQVFRWRSPGATCRLLAIQKQRNSSNRCSVFSASHTLNANAFLNGIKNTETRTAECPWHQLQRNKQTIIIFVCYYFSEHLTVCSVPIVGFLENRNLLTLKMMRWLGWSASEFFVPDWKQTIT